MNLKNIVFFSLLTLAVTLPVIGRNKIVTIFSHGIADTWKQVHGYVKSYQKHNITHRNDRYLIHTHHLYLLTILMLLINSIA